LRRRRRAAWRDARRAAFRPPSASFGRLAGMSGAELRWAVTKGDRRTHKLAARTDRRRPIWAWRRRSSSVSARPAGARDQGDRPCPSPFPTITSRSARPSPTC
jgi:hypothetical protein